MERNGPYLRRGSSYVALLGVSMIVTVIGLSALTAARIRRRAAEGTNDAAEARFYAQSAVDLTLFWIGSDPSWRNRNANSAWTQEWAIGRGTFSFKLVDELDGSLTNDPEDPVRLYAMGRVGDTVRINSVMLVREDTAPDNDLLVNGDMEGGITPWTCLGGCDLESDTDEPHGGVTYMWVKNRDGPWSGPQQDITGKITNGATYDTAVWVKLKDFPENVRLAVWGRTHMGWDSIEVTTAQVGTTWTRVSDTFVPAWGASLLEVYWKIETEWSSQELEVDDAVLVEFDGMAVPSSVKMVPVAGSWRRETLP